MERHGKASSFRDSNVPGDPRLLGALSRRTPNVSGGGLTHVFGSTIIDIPKQRRVASGGAVTICPFGSIVGIDDDSEYTKGIRGGIVICGDKNFNVNVKGIDTGEASNSDSLIYLKLEGIDPNTDDDDEIYLPGIKTCTGTPTFESKPWTEEADYPDNEPPSTPSGTATMYVPFGRLTIVDGSEAFAPTGCGNVTINQCAGIFSYSRG